MSDGSPRSWGVRRIGFSLLEVLVALIVLAASLTAAAAGVAAALRHQAHATARLHLSLALLARAAVLQGEALAGDSGCARLRSGSATTGPVTEQWLVGGHDGARAVRLLAAVRLGARRLSDSAAITVACR